MKGIGALILVLELLKGFDQRAGKKMSFTSGLLTVSSLFPQSIVLLRFEIEATGAWIPWLDCAANCNDFCVDALSKQIYPPPPWAAGKLFLKSLFPGRFLGGPKSMQ